MKHMKADSCLSYSRHDLVELRPLRCRSKAKSRITTSDLQGGDFGFTMDLLGRMNTVWKRQGIHESQLIFIEHLSSLKSSPSQ